VYDTVKLLLYQSNQYVSCEPAGVLSKELTGAAKTTDRPICTDFGTTGKFTGDWVDHPDPEYRHVLTSLMDAKYPQAVEAFEAPVQLS